ncbi:hypothetical protein M427DRAFT_264293 [Gonapodya prolifera JEL478]|uniref:Uncharacterized protein n=1 Tax=Gonapodya prolifera (strain JEL478) TaxID=1344416 RepID=A0A139AK44_GONPJ|nr:hypothetical protein M427DRAFT_264293 [Gonapodya prolifera JEL478]|eukprot:KXS17151.1 hypothetical protein M427DRAFT_264293 [Gonapodya prolifera JEL478]
MTADPQKSSTVCLMALFSPKQHHTTTRPLGLMDTSATETFAPDPISFATAVATVPLEFFGLGPSDHIAHACVYFASDEARYVTGKSICM